MKRGVDRRSTRFSGKEWSLKVECDAQNPERILCALREIQGAALTGRIGKEVRVEPGKVPDGLEL